MLNILLRLTRRCYRPLEGSTHQLRVISVQNFASFTARDYYDRSDETGTLLARFAKHIAIEGQKHAELVPTTIRYSDFFPITDVRFFKTELSRTPPKQLPALLIYASTYRSNADPMKFASALNELDAIAVEKLNKMSEDTVLRMLYALLFLMPNWLTRMDFYGLAMRQLVEQDFREDAPKEKFVQLCFYLGMEKQRAQSKGGKKLIEQLLTKHLEQYLPHLNTMEFAIVSNAAYKTSTMLPGLSAYEERLAEEIQKLPLDGTQNALLVTFLKSMRLQRVRSESTCELLTKICADSEALARIQPRGLVHLFAYFAENRWDDNKVTLLLVEHVMLHMQETNKFRSYAESLRAKDIATFLWCCSQLNCTLSSSDLESLGSLIMAKLRGKGEFHYFPDQLVDCCLALWSLGYKSLELLQETVTLKSQSMRSKAKHQPKVDSRLIVLLSAAQIEKPTWKLKNVNASATGFTPDESVPAYLLKKRADLTELARRIGEEEGVKEVQLTCPIIGINIPGLLVRFSAPNAEVFVELLTDEQILRFSQAPIALISLKQRLLTALQHKVLVLRPNDVAEHYTCIKDLMHEIATTEEIKQESVGAEDVANVNSPCVEDVFKCANSSATQKYFGSLESYNNGASYKGETFIQQDGKDKRDVKKTANKQAKT